MSVIQKFHQVFLTTEDLDALRNLVRDESDFVLLKVTKDGHYEACAGRITQGDNMSLNTERIESKSQ